MVCCETYDHIKSSKHHTSGLFVVIIYKNQAICIVLVIYVYIHMHITLATIFTTIHHIYRNAHKLKSGVLRTGRVMQRLSGKHSNQAFDIPFEFLTYLFTLLLDSSDTFEFFVRRILGCVLLGSTVSTYSIIY